MQNPPKTFLSVAVAALALIFSSCASSHLPSDVRTVSVAPGARRPPTVLAPARASMFARMAAERNTFATNHLRTALAREIDSAGRFQPVPTGRGDAEIEILALRHGLVEVSANTYAVTVGGSVAVSQGMKQLGQREFAGTSGQIRPLAEFEDPAIYEEALEGALNKVALELVSDL